VSATKDTNEAAALLAAGGLSRPDGSGEAAAPGKYNPLLDPAGTERLGALLAERVRSLDPTVVIAWEDPEDAVLAHVVARELGVRALRAWNADGLVDQSSALNADDRAVLVLDALRDPAAVRAVRGIVERDGAQLAGTAVLALTDQLSELGDEPGTVISLTDARADG
jgi:adenine/guanine phosphoribosyltransferase-like PRPP-binding protein